MSAARLDGLCYPAGMTCTPLISVVIPAWNAAATLPATLDSVLGQDYPRLEVIVADDGSTDATGDIVRGYGDRVVHLPGENHGGPSRPRNRGLARATGDLVALFDSDDLMAPGKLSAAARVLNDFPEADLLFTDFRVIDAEDRELAPSVLAHYQSFRSAVERTRTADVGLISGEKLFIELMRANFIGTSSVVFRREAVIEVGGFDEALRNADDRDLWFRLARGGSVFAFLDRIMHSYRSLPGGVTGRGARRLPGSLRVLKRQEKYIRSREARGVWRKAMRRSLASLAWHQRDEGHFAEALRSYARAIRILPTPTNLIGAAATLLLWALPRRSRS